LDIEGLRKLFGRALGFTLASPMVLGGCGGGGGPPDVDTSYSEVTCGSRLDGLTPAVIPDLVELWQIAPGPQHTRILSKGVACATATDAGGCLAELEVLRPDAGILQRGVGVPPQQVDPYLVTTLGNQVRAITTMPDLINFLGTVDSPAEALLLGEINGYTFFCGNRQKGAFKVVDGGIEVVGVSGFLCSGGTLNRTYLTVSPNGELAKAKTEVLEKDTSGAVCGRRPHGLIEKGTRHTRHPLGRHFAQSAQLEAGSVAAFHLLRSDLAFHGAPAALQSEAIDAAHDEVRHTHTTTALARRFGAEPDAPQVAHAPQRALVEIAIENAVEGCLRETWGAVVGHHQAVHATDPHVRRAMKVIAEDETRHAALSWKVHAWAQHRLSTAERSQVREAQRKALAVLRAEVAVAPEAALIEEAGLPDSTRATQMLEQLAIDLWA